MAISGRLLHLKHFFKNNIEVFIPEEEINAINMGSETFEDEMFIGSVFCSDLSCGQKIWANKQQAQNTKIRNERFGMINEQE